MRRLSYKRALIWDVDGTLIDSRSSIFRAAVEAAQAIGVSLPTYDEVRAIVGVSLFEALEMMRPDLDTETIAAYSHEFKEAYIRFHAEPDFHDSLYLGAQEALHRLQAAGWRMGMATGNSRRGVERFLDVYGWREVFDCSFCADDGPSKPHPHMLTCNLVALDVGPDEAIMIGDTAHDIGMARAAGVYAIGVSWGFHTEAELREARPDVIVHDFAELETVLATLAGPIAARTAATH